VLHITDDVELKGVPPLSCVLVIVSLPFLVPNLGCERHSHIPAIPQFKAIGRLKRLIESIGIRLATSRRNIENLNYFPRHGLFILYYCSGTLPISWVYTRLQWDATESTFQWIQYYHGCTGKSICSPTVLYQSLTCDSRANPSMPLLTRSTRTSMIQTTLFHLISSITANHCDRVQRLRCPPRVPSETSDISLQCRSLRSTITMTLSTKTWLQTLLAKSSRTEAAAAAKRRTQ
jgi:hypothetical protein